MLIYGYTFRTFPVNSEPYKTLPVNTWLLYKLDRRSVLLHFKTPIATLERLPCLAKMWTPRLEESFALSSPPPPLHFVFSHSPVNIHVA